MLNCYQSVNIYALDPGVPEARLVQVGGQRSGWIYLDFAVVDKDDYARVKEHKWTLLRSRCNGKRYAYVRDKKSSTYMHTFVTGFSKTDHINHDGLDNRKANLRAVTSSQNLTWSRPRRGGSSKYKGVRFFKRDGTWHARIHVRGDGSEQHLGYFPSELAAARAYDKAALEHFGEYAYTNAMAFPADFGEEG